jgi:hypothetical protein
MDMQKYYSQLVGAKIIGFRFDDDDYALQPYPVFTLRLGGQTVEMTLSMDEEGNGGGFAFIKEYEYV